LVDVVRPDEAPPDEGLPDQAPLLHPLERRKAVPAARELSANRAILDAANLPE
jgi:hypothetical protein